jgi:hypothetical protein
MFSALIPVPMQAAAIRQIATQTETYLDTLDLEIAWPPCRWISISTKFPEQYRRAKEIVSKKKSVERVVCGLRNVPAFWTVHAPPSSPHRNAHPSKTSMHPSQRIHEFEPYRKNHENPTEETLVAAQHHQKSVGKMKLTNKRGEKRK